uniref:tRNA pseudouridine synthase n=1 Tax=Alexandrium monilatum TaxID=311494 RepID=A0A7S4Q563_9DINO
MPRRSGGRPPEQRGPEAQLRQRHREILRVARLRSWPAILRPSRPSSSADSGAPEADLSLGSSRPRPADEGAVRCRMRVAYDGSCYHGWERYHGEPGHTVASVLECALSLLAGQDVRVQGASRTDAGVHARGQAAHFDLTCEAADRRPENWQSLWEQKLNGGLLPPDIKVFSLEETSLDFDARRSASWKRYIYRLHIGPEPADPLERWFRAPVYSGIAAAIGGDVSRLRAAAERFAGTHDFRAFSKADKSRPRLPTERTLQRVEVVDEGRGRCRIELDVNGALWRMVRCIVGCVLVAGAGRLPLSAIDEALANPAGVVPRWEAARAGGLCLEWVHYDDEPGF